MLLIHSDVNCHQRVLDLYGDFIPDHHNSMIKSVNSQHAMHQFLTIDVQESLTNAQK